MNPIAERAWRALPKPVQDAVATGVDRVRGYVPPPPPLPDLDRPTRLLVGPVNYAGQGYQWSRAVERTGLVSARNYVHAENNVLRYDSDYVVPWRTAEHSRSWQKSMADTIARDYTHVLLEACFPVLGGRYGGDVRRQVADLQDAGVKIAVVGHGTDVRLPSTHLRHEPWSMFQEGVWVGADLVEKVVSENLRLVAELDVPTFVSTPGLLLDLPQAHLLGVIVDPARWANDERLLEHERVRVVHAPTNPEVKGTPALEPVVRRLEAEGLIEYTEIRGIPNEQMPAVFAAADVVLDQFRIGDYGVGASETMAAGRVVVAHVSEQARTAAAAAAGMPLPVVEANLDDLESVLRDIAARRSHYREIARSGPEFVRRLHDGTFSARVLSDEFLGT